MIFLHVLPRKKNKRSPRELRLKRYLMILQHTYSYMAETIEDSVYRYPYAQGD